MSTPYWGQLPGPKVAQVTQATHHRRRSESDDYTYNADRRSELDVQPVRRSNRASVQTQATEAPSESTFSPHDSPSSSGFPTQGLAPRPPSYQRGPPRDPASEPSDFRRRRPSRNQEDFDEPESPSFSTAPEASRGPPVSYRHPYGNGGLPYTHAASGAPGESSQLANPIPVEDEDDMDPEEYYKSSGGRAGGSQYPGRAPGEPARQNSTASAYNPPPSSRRATGSSSRRKKFADDRSPLQRLELTLDSITKEEKRARVEAAEHRARERAALRAEEQSVEPQPVEPQVRFHERQPSASHSRRPSVAKPAATRQAPIQGEVFREAPREVSRDTPREAPREVIRGAPRNVPIQRGNSTRQSPLTQHPYEEPDYYGSGALQDPEDVTAQRHGEAESGIPKRNLSFRERAAKDNAPLSEQAQPKPQSPLVPVPSGGFSLTRSGSNKLKKPPPGDPWYHMKKDIASTSKNPSQTEQPCYDSRAFPPSTRDKELPLAPVDGRRPSIDVGGRPSIDAGRPSIDTGGRNIRIQMPDENQGVRRRATEPAPRAEYYSDEEYIPPVTRGKTFAKGAQDDFADPQDAAAARRRAERADSFSSDGSHHHHFSNMVFKRREDMTPGDGLYKPPQYLDEWKKATVGTLAGTLLDLDEAPKEHDQTSPEQNTAWWEEDRRRLNSYSSRPRKAEAFDGEYDESAPTRFKPPLFLKCGPLLRYCGVRREKVAIRPQRGSTNSERELWRGSVMIVTQDSGSSYEIAPTLRLFVQGMELLPPPPHRVKGDLSPEYVDPIVGHPKLGRRGETLYVRPVEHLEEAKDLSRDETDDGLFEQSRSPPDVLPADGSTELPGTFHSRRKRVGIDGEKVQKYKDVRGFRLHAERGYTFWRFNVEVELRDQQQRIAYRINRGPATGFWVPARGETMNMMFHSCNGFSLSVKSDELSGPDPMWRDVLNSHQTNPFHLMIGGGDQIYNDAVGGGRPCELDHEHLGCSGHCDLFQEWLSIRNPVHKHTASLTPEMQDQLETFYLERYCMWFSQGLFGLANSQIPMVNMWDDHDIFDGYGSYPHHDMNSPVFRGLGAVAFKYYMLFQQQTILDETDKTEPSWILGAKPGPYIGELGRSIFVSVGSKAALVAIDARMERTEHDVVSDQTWEKIMNRLYAELRRGQVEHLLVLLGVPIAYPRLVWLENILTSRLMNPVKALGRAGVFGKALNNIDGGVEVLDDLNDHWTAKNHKQERSVVIEDLQDLAIDKSVRITILSGDVHLAAVGQFYSNPKLGLPKHKDPRYMPNVISSAIANTPPPDLMADVLNKRNKVHHFDKQTDEDMIPMFQQGVDGKPRNNKHLLPHRNWCSIREWAPGNTPPPTPPQSSYNRTPSPPASGGGLLRRLSLSKSRPAVEPQIESRESVRGPRPPVTRGVGGLFRSLSRRNSTSKDSREKLEQPAKLTRSMSVDHGEAPKKAGFFSFGRRSSQRRPNDGGINGNWGDEPEYEEEYWDEPQSPRRQRGTGLRGGAAYEEYTVGDDSQYMAQPPRRVHTTGSQGLGGGRADEEGPVRRPFHRTPTGLSTKQKRQADKYEVDLEGGLDICLNVEVNPKDPAGITAPYRLLVPKLLYEYSPEVDDLPVETAEPAAAAEPTGFKRLLSFRKKPEKVPPQDDYEYSDEEDDYPRR
ncbi:Uncharacterized protein AK830_g605 [Neonectria ditissima]|uniref:PhoD-like phosphatase domain-containing protein n=1 Tax=Neonectria ditissima TaxID=78410 RepID=A0A0P7BGH2_9HYPO|nr:Uncharacterized protein AK830_g605 [Neonectria ditissima]